MTRPAEGLAMTRSMGMLIIGLLLITPMSGVGAAPSQHQEVQPADPRSDESARRKDDSPEQLKCRRQPVTGSLVKRVRVCKTEREWERDATESRRATEETVERGSTWGRGSPGS